MTDPAFDLAALQALFRPRSIAVIGASDDPTTIGGRPVHYLKQRFAGRVHPVNPKRATVQGLASHATIGEIDGPVDLAILAVPAARTLEVAEACFARGVGGLVVFTAGFAELGEAGRRDQQRLAALARAADARVLGPNCLGYCNFHDGVFATFSTTLEHGETRPGAVGIVSQSGAFGSHCAVVARQRGLGLSHWIATGNECDVDLADGLAFLAADPRTEVIVSYAEGCRDGPRLRAAFALARANRKPVVIMKVGSSAAGAAAAASHTAALAGSDRVYEAVFAADGVWRAGSVDELIDVAYACHGGRYPAGRRLGLLTLSGGVGIVMADEAARRGLDVAPMPAAAAAELARLLPFAAVGNPVDTTAQVYNDMSLVTKFADGALGSGAYDSLIAFYSTLGLSDRLAEALLAAFRPVREAYPDHVILLSILAGEAWRRRFEAAGFLLFDDPNRAVRAVAALAWFAASLAAPRRPDPPPAPRLAPPFANEATAKRALAAAGLPVAAEHLVDSADAAAAAAEALGFPVVLKIASPDIAHKSEIGGVILGLSDAAAVRQAHATLIERARRHCPAARLDGVVVARMIAGGVETIIGTQRDPTFGPVVLLGLGGIFAELFPGAVLRPAPVDLATAREMVQALPGRALLEGARGRPRADKEALARAVSLISAIGAANADAIDSIDVNPFILLPEGQGGVAVDALIVPRSPAGAAP